MEEGFVPAMGNIAVMLLGSPSASTALHPRTGVQVWVKAMVFLLLVVVAKLGGYVQVVEAEEATPLSPNAMMSVATVLVLTE